MPILNILHTIKSHEANQRLDAVLFHIVQVGNSSNSISRTTITRNIRTGLVFINNKPVKPTYHVKTGDIVAGTITLPEIVTALIPNTALHLPMIFENEFFLIIDKPAGLLTHPIRLNQTESVANWAIAHDPCIATVGENPLRPGIVHRLDQDTSGLLIIAKTQESFLEFKRLFQTHKIHKIYLALIHGHLNQPQGTINTPLARALTGNRQTTVSDHKKTKGPIRTAITKYSVIQSFDNYSFIEARPQTGRKHQIRVHLASIGHSVIGDKLYSTKATRSLDQSCHHQCLHAYKLEFSLFNHKYSFESPLPKNFQNFQDGFQKKY